MSRQIFDARLATPALCDVHVCCNEAAPFDWHAAYLERGPIWTLALECVRIARFRQCYSFRDQLFDVAGSVFTAARVEAKYLFEEWRFTGKKTIRKIQKLAHRAVGKDHT